jgi:hypothetical protein
LLACCGSSGDAHTKPKRAPAQGLLCERRAGSMSGNDTSASCDLIADTTAAWVCVSLCLLSALISPSLSRLIFVLLEVFKKPAIIKPAEKLLVLPLSLLLSALFVWIVYLTIPGLCGISRLKFVLYVVLLGVTLVLTWFAAYRIFRTLIVVLPVLLTKQLTRTHVHVLVQGLRITSILVMALLFVVFSVIWLDSLTLVLHGLETLFYGNNVFTWFLYIILVVPFLRDILGLVSVLVDEPFVVGEFVSVHDQAGVVVAIGFFHVSVRLADSGGLAQIPMSAFVQHPVINYSRRALRPVKFRIPIAHHTRLDGLRVLAARIQSELERSLKTVQGVCVVPAPEGLVLASQAAYEGSFQPWAYGRAETTPLHLEVSFLAAGLSLMDQSRVKTKAIAIVLREIEEY